jgi:hypothetical protein
MTEMCIPQSHDNSTKVHQRLATAGSVGSIGRQLQQESENHISLIEPD